MQKNLQWVLNFRLDQWWDVCVAYRSGVAGHHAPKANEGQGLLRIDLFPWAAVYTHKAVSTLLIPALASIGVNDLDIKNTPIYLFGIFFGRSVGVDIAKISHNVADVFFPEKLPLTVQRAILVMDLDLGYHTVGDSVRTAKNAATACQGQNQRQQPNKIFFKANHFCAITPELECPQNKDFIVEKIRKNCHY